jgi:hypothetical protein
VISQQALRSQIIQQQLHQQKNISQQVDQQQDHQTKQLFQNIQNRTPEQHLGSTTSSLSSSSLNETFLKPTTSTIQSHRMCGRKLGITEEEESANTSNTHLRKESENEIGFKTNQTKIMMNINNQREEKEVNKKNKNINSDFKSQSESVENGNKDPLISREYDNNNNGAIVVEGNSNALEFVIGEIGKENKMV